MLEELVVENYALIENVRVGFTNGLNILTGETGAGKSILVGALGLLLGLKADTAQIRTGADELRVAGIANVKGNPDAQHWLSEHGIAAEEGSLILRRTVRRNGKSSLYIQSTPATLRDLRELAWLLFDMHGQHEHQSLLLRDNHRKLLDRFGATLEEAEEYHALYDHYQRLQIESEQLASSERERSREMDFLAYTIQEIDSAHLQADEEQELERDKLRIANAERLYSLLEETHTLLVGGHEAALVGVRRALDALEQVVQVDAEMAQQRDQLQECAYTLEDVAEAIRHSRQAVVFDPGRLEEVNERLSIIKRLEKKYGATVADVLAYAASCRQKLEGLENWEQKLGVLEKRLEESRKQLAARAAELSQRRRQAALDLRGKVEGELAQLGMPKARFQVAVGDDDPQGAVPAVGGRLLVDVDLPVAVVQRSAPVVVQRKAPVAAVGGHQVEDEGLVGATLPPAAVVELIGDPQCLCRLLAIARVQDVGFLDPGVHAVEEDLGAAPHEAQ